MELNDMDMTPFEKAVRALDFGERRRRLIATICVLWGLVMVGLSLWVQHRSEEAIGRLVESFYDTPMVAMPVMSAITTTISNSRVHFLIGIVFIGFGMVRFYIPDFKTIALLEVVKHLNLAHTEANKDDA